MKRFVESALNRLGYELTRRQPGNRAIVGMNAGYLSRLGNPKTVFDVGVGFGTWALYEAFPHAKIVLVEPLRDYAATIERICAKYECLVCYAAASDHIGGGTIHVDPENLELTTFSEHTALTTRGRRMARDIRITTLDAILAEHPELQPPFFLKIDTEGHELDVLRGATNLLTETETVLAEVSIAPRFVGGYRFEDMISFMRDQGFSLAAIVNVAHASLELRPRFADLAFQRSRYDL